MKDRLQDLLQDDRNFVLVILFIAFSASYFLTERHERIRKRIREQEFDERDSL